VTVYFGQFFGNYKRATHSYSYALILAKKIIGLQYTLGEFFTNSSGHPGHDEKNSTERDVSHLAYWQSLLPAAGGRCSDLGNCFYPFLAKTVGK
jgi:hypothetical protein